MSKGGTNHTASWLLRLGLAFVFGYVAIESFMHPNDWVGYLPHGLTKFMSAYSLLKVFSVYEIVLTVWLLSGKFLKLASLLTAATLVAIVVTNPPQFPITFRDIGLAFAALALFFTN